MDKHLIVKIDCAEEYDPENYFSSSTTSIIKTEAGRYREAQGIPKDRFGYRFFVEDKTKPHLVRFYVPDDKRRFMTVADGLGYDLNTGVLTGDAQPLTGKMIPVDYIFWPRYSECSIVFMTYGKDEPAACSGIEVYELSGLPGIYKAEKFFDGPAREIGTQYEDPCGNLMSEGAFDRETWIERAVEYLKASGQNLLVYPMAWYHGPIFPSINEPADELGCFLSEDKKVYGWYDISPKDWYQDLLKRLSDENISFVGSFTLMRLGSLMEKMCTDENSAKAGVQVINNVRHDGRVQTGTMDWTIQYNARNYPQILQAGKVNEGISPSPGAVQEFKFAYDEKTIPGFPVGPIFNPLHPEVQFAIRRFVTEIAERYGSYSAFKGICFNLFGSCMPWFGSIKSGYDDYTVSLFVEETGMKIPGDADDPERFRQRYDFLTTVCRQAWIDWRCRKIRDLIRLIRDDLKAVNSKLEVTISLWLETFIPQILGLPGKPAQIYSRNFIYELYREGGIDIDLYANEEGIMISSETGNSRDRGGHGMDATSGIYTPAEYSVLYRDQDYMDRDFSGRMAKMANSATFIFDCWVEIWEKHLWARIKEEVNESDTFLTRTVREDDGFWWDPGFMITPPFYLGEHYLEPFTHALAEYDTLRISRGGLFLDRAHMQQMSHFAEAFSTLPRVKFETIGSTDPVAVRQKIVDGRLFFYVVNQDFCKAEITLDIESASDCVMDLVTEEKICFDKQLKMDVLPYELKCFAIEGSAGIKYFTTKLEESYIDYVTKESESALRVVTEAENRGCYIPGMDAISTALKEALASGRYGWARRAAGCYIVRRCRELTV